MDKKINTITTWGVDNIYNAVMSGSVKSFDSVLKITEVMTLLKAKQKYEEIKPATEDITIEPPANGGGL